MAGMMERMVTRGAHHDSGDTRQAPGRQTAEAVGAQASWPDGRQESAEEVVAARDPDEQRAGPRSQRVQASKPEGRGGLAQALGPSQQAPQGLALPVGGVDAQLLHQSRRKGVEARTATRARACQRRATQSLRA